MGEMKTGRVKVVETQTSAAGERLPGRVIATFTVRAETIDQLRKLAREQASKRAGGRRPCVSFGQFQGSRYDIVAVVRP
jgi:hypothetical protein